MSATIEERLRAANKKAPKRFTGTITEDATTADPLTRKVEQAAHLVRKSKGAGRSKE